MSTSLYRTYRIGVTIFFMTFTKTHGSARTRAAFSRKNQLLSISYVELNNYIGSLLFAAGAAKTVRFQEQPHSTCL